MFNESRPPSQQRPAADLAVSMSSNNKFAKYLLLLVCCDPTSFLISGFFPDCKNRGKSR